jgi:hypothetical protein
MAFFKMSLSRIEMEYENAHKLFGNSAQAFNQTLSKVARDWWQIESNQSLQYRQDVIQQIRSKYEDAAHQVLLPSKSRPQASIFWPKSVISLYVPAELNLPFYSFDSIRSSRLLNASHTRNHTIELQRSLQP